MMLGRQQLLLRLRLRRLWVRGSKQLCRVLTRALGGQGRDQAALQHHQQQQQEWRLQHPQMLQASLCPTFLPHPFQRTFR